METFFFPLHFFKCSWWVLVGWLVGCSPPPPPPSNDPTNCGHIVSIFLPHIFSTCFQTHHEQGAFSPRWEQAEPQFALSQPFSIAQPLESSLRNAAGVMSGQKCSTAPSQTHATLHGLDEKEVLQGRCHSGDLSHPAGGLQVP